MEKRVEVCKGGSRQFKRELRNEPSPFQRQYDRLIEMLILRSLDSNDEASQRAFRLQVKARLKVFNFVGTAFIV
jgi:histone acetyltransferase 1